MWLSLKSLSHPVLWVERKEGAGECAGVWLGEKFYVHVRGVESAQGALQTVSLTCIRVVSMVTCFAECGGGNVS